MNTLFPIEPLLPKGFSYYPGFITEDEEMILNQDILKIKVTPLLFQGYEGNGR